MTHALVLTCDPVMPAVTPDVIGAARALLHRAGETRALAPEPVAVEIPFTPAAPLDRDGRRIIAAGIRRRLKGAKVDVAVVEVADRRKRLFLADMDSTMILQECIDELADYVGLKEKVSGITERAMRGEIAFEPALRERVALLAGLPASVAGEIVENRIGLTPGGRALVATMRANGAYACLVSGGFTLFTGPIGALIGFDEHRSNRLVLDGEKLAGRVEEPILGREAKRDTLIELRARLGLGDAQTLAVGDGANDLAMLGEAGLGVAFRAKPAVAEAADVSIRHGDLTSLLYLQGYTRADFRSH
jgi:phosphoserine phosphatase